MTWLFLMLVLWAVVGRSRRRRRMRAWRRFARLRGWETGEDWERHVPHRLARARGWQAPERNPRAPVAAPPESRFDALKRRYVSGELTDRQYEEEIDALLRRPGGMQEF